MEDTGDRGSGYVSHRTCLLGTGTGSSSLEEPIVLGPRAPSSLELGPKSS